MGWEASLDDRALGRLVKWFAFLTLLAIFVVLLFVYLRLSGGELPFSFRDIQGVPAWAPFLAFVVGFAVFAAAPAVLGRVSGRPATFYDLLARNRRNSILLAVATILGTGLTAYALFTVVSLHASVGLAAGDHRHDRLLGPGDRHLAGRRPDRPGRFERPPGGPRR